MEATTTTTTMLDQNETVCTWQPKPECVTTFEYKGVNYTGCTKEDLPTAWCSHDAIHKGSFSTCTRVCVPVPAPAPSPAPPTTPIPPVKDEPCDRHPEAENDIIGNTVTLDEAGYKVTAAADSPINAKRFICRVVKKLECKVVDLAALMAFVPYYSGATSQQTYKKLESELETLCHAGGKWVVAKSEAESEDSSDEHL
jgi:hypothetical protein